MSGRLIFASGGPAAFLLDSVGSGEWLLLAVVILIVYGPRRLPEMARKIGHLLAQLRQAADSFHDQLMSLDAPSAVDEVMAAEEEEKQEEEEAFTPASDEGSSFPPVPATPPPPNREPHP